MSSLDYRPPSFICLVVKNKADYWFPKKTVGETTYFIIDNSYISDVQYENTSNSHHLQPVLGCNNKEGERSDQYCWACRSYKIGTTYFYYCKECISYYHKECVESPPIFTSSYHPKYPLQLLKYDRGTRRECLSCGLEIYVLVYHSSISDLFMDPLCARKPEFSTIHNPERHEHTLHYFPRKAPLTCDVCASDDTKSCFYSCLQCDFIVHRRCINLPHVIRISCHNHRLSFTSSLPFGNSWFCGVCRRKMDENYGSYSCTKNCAYAVHTNCATLLDVWAGKELKGQAELEDDNIKPSFEKMDDGIIRHFRHANHRMRLIEDIEGVFDAKQQYCQALPYKVKYEHDEHMLTLSYEKIASGPCWCQICEETTDPKKGYYTCGECRVTFHTECVLGNDIYLKEGRELYTFYGRKVEIIPNNRLSRPICHHCRKRCQYNIVFKNYLGNIFCSSIEK
ncbi:Cysteine/Histidine-rich C1 domain family protein [Raphanus sativus]|nr:Cysteine/Histidine-rich C1 domain family protein [Raphanus sativus]